MATIPMVQQSQIQGDSQDPTAMLSAKNQIDPPTEQEQTDSALNAAVATQNQAPMPGTLGGITDRLSGTVGYQPPAGAAPPPAAPAPPAAPSRGRVTSLTAPNGAESPSDQIQADAQTEGAARQREGQAQADLGTQNAQSLKSLGDYQAAREQSRQAIAGELSSQYDDKLRDFQKQVLDYSKQGIDPNHYWNNRSTGQKIGLIIGQAFGGFANGWSGGKIPNATADMIKSQVENDVRAQQINLDQKGKALGEQRSMIGMSRDAGIDRLHEFDASVAAHEHLIATQIRAQTESATGQAQKAAGEALAANIDSNAVAKIQGIKQSAAQISNQWSELHLKKKEMEFNQSQVLRNNQIQQNQLDLMKNFTQPGEGGSASGTDEQANQVRALMPEVGARLAHLGPGQNVLMADKDTAKDTEDTLSLVASQRDKVQQAMALAKKAGSFTVKGLENPTIDQAESLKNDMAAGALKLADFKRVSPLTEKVSGAEELPDVSMPGTVASKLARLKVYDQKLADIQDDVFKKHGIKNSLSVPDYK